MPFLCRDKTLSLDSTVIMGVLNVTPDSFSDGGLYLDPAVAVARAHEMVRQGAGIVDVGGESTRPHAAPVDESEELRRVMPVIEALSDDLEVPLSIDTRKPAVARRAIEAGASIVNDTLGEAAEESMDEVVAETGAGVVVMHSRGTPATMRSLTDYDDVARDVASFLSTRATQLRERGVPAESVAVDPGIGFAKDPSQNLALLRSLPTLVELGYPVVVGTSRKSFIGALLGLPTDQRLEATLASVSWAVAMGARIVRVHDVEATSRAVRMVEAIRDAPSSG